MKYSTLLTICGLIYSLCYTIPAILKMLGYDFEANDIDLVMALLLFIYSKVVED